MRLKFDGLGYDANSFYLEAVDQSVGLKNIKLNYNVNFYIYKNNSRMIKNCRDATY